MGMAPNLLARQRTVITGFFRDEDAIEKVHIPLAPGHSHFPPLSIGQCLGAGELGEGEDEN
jgi:hypothetical protein